MRTFTIIVLLFTCVSAAAQEETRDTLMDKVLFKKLVNKEFSSLITGQTKNSLGNFASLDLKDFSLAASTIFKKGGVLTIKATGTVSDGLYSIFSNSKLNTQVNLDLQFNCLANRKLVIRYDHDSLVAYGTKLQQYRSEYLIKVLETQRNIEALNRDSKIRGNRLQINYIDSIIANVNVSQQVLDSLFYERSRLLLSNRTLEEQDIPIPAIQRDKADHDRIQKEEKLSLGLSGFNFGWFSIGYKVNNNKFKHFSPIDNIVTDLNFVSHEVRAQYARYNFSIKSFSSYFWQAGLAFQYTDNFDALTKKELIDVTNYTPVQGERTSTKKYNVYEGDYSKNKVKLKFYGDFYYFLFPKNIAAIHLFPEHKVAKGENPVTNCGVGFLFSYKDDKTDGAIINAELYYNFLDIFKTTESTYKFFERNDIGLRFTFPIKFKQ